jgi:hypothetical protein
MVRNARLNIGTGLSMKNAAVAACSGVLDEPVAEPSVLTSLYSAVYWSLVRSGMPSDRNWSVLRSVNGRSRATQAFGSLTNAGSAGRHSPGSVPIAKRNGPFRPSPSRLVSIALAAAAPAAIPSAFAWPSGMAAREPT